MLISPVMICRCFPTREILPLEILVSMIIIIVFYCLYVIVVLIEAIINVSLILFM